MYYFALWWLDQSKREERSLDEKLSKYVLGRLMWGSLVVAPIYLALLPAAERYGIVDGSAEAGSRTLLPKRLPADQVLSLVGVS